MHVTFGVLEIGALSDPSSLLLFSILTPYYREDVFYSEEELNQENEDGISILFYLQKIYPGKLQFDSNKVQKNYWLNRHFHQFMLHLHR